MDKNPARSSGTTTKKHHWALWAGLLLILVPALAVSAWVWTTLHVAYSNGERAGYVQKISRKGWVCKTWEGELAINNIPGAVPQIFFFSVPDDSVARQIENAAGQRVALSYEQHKGVPSKCFGETEYFVTGVRRITP